uniref:Uncharacterized protein n=1 Tax=Anguilla anguilla TaxID=7936 RepID=A0A0E9R2I2_ANGAN
MKPMNQPPTYKDDKLRCKILQRYEYNYPSQLTPINN